MRAKQSDNYLYIMLTETDVKDLLIFLESNLP